MTISTPLFTQHSRSWRDNRFVYPVISRRSKGLSIGVNLNPDQACNFDCVYCSVDRTEKPTVRSVDLARVRAELNQLLELAVSGALWNEPPFDRTPPELRRLNDVAFSGDGEPTSYPGFGEACRLAVELIRWHNAPAKVVVITNATLLDRPEVQEALSFLDTVPSQIWAKLDAGTEDYYRLIERTKVPLKRVLDNLLLTAKARPIVIQSMFLRYRGDAPSAAEIDAYLGRLRDLIAGGCRISLVQVYTVARSTAEAEATPLNKLEIDAIVAQVRALSIPAEAYYGPG
ncbi:MAG TPA: radical SAM protein [Planctomycetota bacterium]|nr:radical SAM protein [Planctomycetota bacterium]